jgi:hypothetical protein
MGKGRWLVAVAGVFAVVGTLAFAIKWRDSGARPVSIDAARRRVEGTESSVPVRPSTLRPPPGVYQYRGSGTEHLDKPPKSQSQGPPMPATITYRADGCWVFRLDYSTGHWQSWTYCERAGQLDEIGGQTFERWDFVAFKVDSTSTFTCTSSVTIRPTMRAGDHWTQTCTGTSSAVKGVTTTSGPFTYLGDDTVNVGGTKVAAYHFKQLRTLTGSQTGTQENDVWFAKSNGMPLRNDHRNLVKSDSPSGTVTYTESGTFVLQSMRSQG